MTSRKVDGRPLCLDCAKCECEQRDAKQRFLDSMPQRPTYSPKLFTGPTLHVELRQPESHRHSPAAAIRDLARAIFLTDPRLVARIALVAESNVDSVRLAIETGEENSPKKRILRCVDLAWGSEDGSHAREPVLRAEAEKRAAEIAAVMSLPR